ncbi:MAG: NAD+ synthase [Bacteroidetes bacterium]|nr:MAG: NAD+ synthase [Bacteroidota bacterium]REK03477.1 MAG: NAD+ synthase [Bacteroidota bacterium]REK34782.1 MAG: NAD+ synthase [Bacteroidota bacterium]REK51339.1 MAG: NAD+ synthase [Bacteroidota bacterium]
MRIALAQLNFVIGDFEKNSLRIKESISKAKSNQASLIVFPELCISAYPPQDFLEFDDFVERCNKIAQEIAKECTGITAIIGLPTVNPEPEGKNLFNSAAILSEGRITDVVHKALLPNYDIFDEYRYFEPGRNPHSVVIDDTRIALTICEDLWNIEDDPMYVHCPMDSIINENPELMINIAASPFSYEHRDQRQAILLRNVRKYSLPLMYVNHVGAQTQIIFDGGSVVYDKHGNMLHEMNYFREDIQYFEFNKDTGNITHIQGERSYPVPSGKTERIYQALITGISDYFGKLGFKKAILGLSGGIDSAVVSVLAAHALGSENVRALLMPSAFSSEGSVKDSLELVKNAGISHDIIPIEPAFQLFRESLAPQFGDLPFGVAEENIQARIRGLFLMAMSNKFGYILLNTSNKSEIAVGYGTLYGDMCGGLSVIGDLYKSEVYELAAFINSKKKTIPQSIIEKAPSAELRPDQKDSDSLPDYGILDQILYQYIEKRKGPGELISMGFEKELIQRVLKMVNTNEYKRFQTPPILRVSSKSFGSGRRLPIVGKYLS